MQRESHRDGNNTETDKSTTPIQTSSRKTQEKGRREGMAGGRPNSRIKTELGYRREKTEEAEAGGTEGLEEEAEAAGSPACPYPLLRSGIWLLIS